MIWNENRKYVGLLIIGIFWLIGCTKPKTIKDDELVQAWIRLSLHILKTTPANTPTFASRSLGYIGLTMYESVVPGYAEYNSLVGQLNGLDSLPLIQAQKNYIWQLCLNAGQAQILRSIYIQTSDENKFKIDSLESYFNDIYENTISDKQSIELSKSFGKAVANCIFNWSKSDGGHRGYLKNFDKTLKFKERPGSWQPPLYAQSFSHYPLHPHWGKNRTFLKQNAGLKSPDFISYNNDPNSAYYKQFLEVYKKEKSLSQAEKEAAIWWGDDPDETFTPPGHSYFLASKLIKNKNLIQSAETMAKVGMAVADAFINCWKWKYQFFSERPNTFITKHIDETWVSFWPDPPFPAFPSGHAIQAGAASSVLIPIYGDKLTFIDSSNVGRKPDELRQVAFKPRTFTSLSQIAKEIADSRFYGGIHTPQDNARGLEKGKEIAENINNLKWKK
jgi:hypothetical protein